MKSKKEVQKEIDTIILHAMAHGLGEERIHFETMRKLLSDRILNLIRRR